MCLLDLSAVFVPPAVARETSALVQALAQKTLMGFMAAWIRLTFKRSVVTSCFDGHHSVKGSCYAISA